MLKQSIMWCAFPTGYCLDLASPLFPSAFLFLACLGGIARSITGGKRLQCGL